MQFMVHCIDKPNHLEVRLANRPAHAEHLKAHIDHVVIGGPTFAEDGQTMSGSMLVMDFPDRAQLDIFLANDPYAKADLFAEVRVIAYKKVFP